MIKPGCAPTTKCCFLPFLLIFCFRGAWHRFHCRGQQDVAGMRTGDRWWWGPRAFSNHGTSWGAFTGLSSWDIFFSWWLLNPFHFRIKWICLPHQLPNGFESCFLPLKFLPWFCSWVSSNPTSLAKAAAAPPLLQTTLRTMIFSIWLITYVIIFHSEGTHWCQLTDAGLNGPKVMVTFRVLVVTFLQMKYFYLLRFSVFVFICDI